MKINRKRISKNIKSLKKLRIISLVGVIFLSFFLYIVIKQYASSFIIYDNLLNKTVTYDGYRKKDVGFKFSNYLFLVYFTEDDSVYGFSLKSSLINQDWFDSNNGGEKVKIYYLKRASLYYDYEICEMSTESGTMIFSLDTYKTVQRNNAITGLVLVSIPLLITSALLIYSILRIKKLTFIIGLSS